MRKVYCAAKGRIGFGKRVLVRGRLAEAAEPELANGTALKPPPWDRRRFHRDGESVVVLMDDALGTRDLHAIANGPIMDPGELYLPAGKISMDAYRERQRQILNPEDSLPTPRERTGNRS